MVLSADVALNRAVGEKGALPAAVDILYEGGMASLNSSGYANSLVAGEPFAGHIINQCDNSGGSAGDKDVELLAGKYRLEVTLTSVVVTDVGRYVYASDDTTLTLVGASASAAYSCVGKVVQRTGTNKAIVEFEPYIVDEFGPNLNRILKTDDYTIVAATDTGKIIYLGTDAKTATLPATVSNTEVTLVNCGADGAAGIMLDFNAADLNIGGCGMAAGGDGKKLTNTKATARRGDYLKVGGDGTNGYHILDKRGTWAQES